MRTPSVMLLAPLQGDQRQFRSVDVRCPLEGDRRRFTSIGYVPRCPVAP